MPGEAVDSVETVDKIKEARWCEHVKANGSWIYGSKPCIVVATPHVHMVIEDGIVKILCARCFLVAVQTPLFI